VRSVGRWESRMQRAELESWHADFGSLHASIAHRFSRSKARHRAQCDLAGILGQMERKSGCKRLEARPKSLLSVVQTRLCSSGLTHARVFMLSYRVFGRASSLCFDHKRACGEQIVFPRTGLLAKWRWNQAVFLMTGQTEAGFIGLPLGRPGDRPQGFGASVGVPRCARMDEKARRTR
jgi:hypothetical protein